MATKQQLEKQLKDKNIQIKNLEIKIEILKNNYEEEIANIKKEFTEEINKMKSLVESTLAHCATVEQENTKLREELLLVKKENKELREQIDRLNGKAIKNSSNSSIPSSKEENKEKKKIVNHREKTNRKKGGQNGRQGKTLTVKEIEKMIETGKAKVTVEEYGNDKLSKTTVKYVVDVETITKIRKIIIHGNVKKVVANKKLPTYLITKSPVIYGDNIKVLVGIMSELEIIAYDRMQEFINILTDGVLNISHGSLVNWVSKISEKCDKFVKKISKRIKGQNVIYTDATNTCVNGRKAYVRNYSTEHITIYKPSSSKSIKTIRSHGILNGYFGHIMHDHETGLYNFSLKEKHLECWVHLGRDLKYTLETTNNSWTQEMWELGWDANKKRKEYLKNGITAFSESELEEFNNKFDEIIAKGYEQNKKVESNHYRGKEYAIINRLKKYKDNYTLFIRDFSLPFDDNLSERDLRMIKTKKKIIGCHRSFDGLKDYCKISTVISTCKKQSISFFKVLKKLLNDEPIQISKLRIYCNIKESKYILI